MVVAVADLSSQNSPYDLTGFYQSIVSSLLGDVSSFLFTFQPSPTPRPDCVSYWLSGWRDQYCPLGERREGALAVSVLMCQWCSSSQWATGARAHQLSQAQHSNVLLLPGDVNELEPSLSQSQPRSCQAGPMSGQNWWAGHSLPDRRDSPSFSSPRSLSDGRLGGWETDFYSDNTTLLPTTPTQQLQHFHQQHQLSPGSWERATRPGLHDLSVRLQTWQRQHFPARESRRAAR